MVIRIEEKKYCVYAHINKVNNKIYIGITSNVKNRWYPCNYKNNTHFQGAIQKYGWDNFNHIIIIDNLDIETASECEKYLINKYNTRDPNIGYNICEGGLGCVLNREYDSYNSLRIPVYQYDLNGNFIKEWDCAFTAEKELSIGIYQCLYGYKRRGGDWLWSYEKHEKIPAYEYYKGVNRCNILVFQYDLNGNFINRYDNIYDNFDRNYCNRIYMCCNKKILTMDNCFWVYENEANSESIFKRILERKYSMCRIKEKEKYLKIPITQFDINGNYVKCFSNVFEAAYFLNISESILCKNANDQNNHILHNFVYKFGDFDVNTTIKVSIRTKNVFQFSLNGDFVKKWDSINDAQREYGSGITGAIIRNTTHKSNGFLWFTEEQLNDSQLIYNINKRGD